MADDGDAANPGDVNEGGDPSDVDLFGRSLPVQYVGRAAESTSDGARFVRQLQTDALIENGRKGTESTSTVAVAGASPPSASSSVSQSMSFEIGAGTILTDSCASGDVDMVLRGKAAVTALQTWPTGHPCSVVDRVLIESLREDEATGMPAWLFITDGE